MLILMGPKPICRATRRTFEHALELIAPGDLEETLGVKAIEVNVQAAKSGVVQRLCVSREQHAVGGEREIADAGNARDLLDEDGQVAPDQRFPAGKPDFGDPHLRGNAHEPFDLFEGQ